MHDNEKSGSAPRIVLNAALLVAGTTIGGGFLALPTVVAPSGFAPSAVALCLTWLFFLAQSFVLVQALDYVRVSKHVANPGVSVAAKATFGQAGEAIVALLLIVLTAATLVSQISRAGILFSSSLVSYPLACSASALLVAAVVFGPSRGIEFASEANATLTALFLLSSFGVALYGAPIADWSRLVTTKSWSAVPDAIPIFLQLLVYGEILPVVCQLLNYKMKLIRLAIGLGSFLTLLLQISWAALGICLISKPGMDPVSALVCTGPSPIRFSLFSLSITAILTTILGSYLAMLSAYKDLTNTDITTSGKSRLKAAALIVLPALAISCASPKMFLKAIDFAGSYPVLLLWGVVPPLM
jgi:amino acid permease